MNVPQPERPVQTRGTGAALPPQRSGHGGKTVLKATRILCSTLKKPLLRADGAHAGGLRDPILRGWDALHQPCVPAPARSPRFLCLKKPRSRIYTGNSALSLCNSPMGFLFVCFLTRPGNCHIKRKYKKNDFPQPSSHVRGSACAAPARCVRTHVCCSVTHRDICYRDTACCSPLGEDVV